MNSLQLDLFGEVCPSPLLKTQEVFAGIEPGTRMVVDTDFARAVRNISHWCGREGLYCRIVTMPRGAWRILIQRAPFED